VNRVRSAFLRRLDGQLDVAASVGLSTSPHAGDIRGSDTRINATTTNATSAETSPDETNPDLRDDTRGDERRMRGTGHARPPREATVGSGR
jgi:hypothetical protein